MSYVVTATVGSEISMSPLHTSRSRFPPSTSTDVPFVIVVFSVQSGMRVNAGLSRAVRVVGTLKLAGIWTMALPRVGSMVTSWVVYAPVQM